VDEASDAGALGRCRKLARATMMREIEALRS
jgi:hypothetical protein